MDKLILIVLDGLNAETAFRPSGIYGAFNGREKGENAIEITRQLAMKFFNDEMSMDEWLSRFYPKQMTVYHKAISQARSQLLGM